MSGTITLSDFLAKAGNPQYLCIVNQSEHRCEALTLTGKQYSGTTKKRKEKKEMTNSNSTSLSLFAKNVLSAIAGNTGVTYNANHNVFLTTGYTSAAGNTYYRAIRLSERLAISYDLGQGYFYTFLNGIKVFVDNHLIGSRSYNCFYFCEEDAMRESAEIVYDFLKSQAKMLGIHLSDSDIRDASLLMVEETIQKRLA